MTQISCLKLKYIINSTPFDCKTCFVEMTMVLKAFRYATGHMDLKLWQT